MNKNIKLLVESIFDDNADLFNSEQEYMDDMSNIVSDNLSQYKPTNMKELKQSIEYCFKKGIPLKYINVDNVNDMGDVRLFPTVLCKKYKIKTIDISDWVISNEQSRISIGNDYIEELTLPKTLKKFSLKKCEKLKKLIIPASISDILFEQQALFGAPFNDLESIIIDPANPCYDSRNNCNAVIDKQTNELMYGCKTTIIPDTVTSIKAFAFLNCIGLERIDIPDSVTSICNNAFMYCYNLLDVTLQNSVTTIGSSAFAACYKLKNITFGNSITSIGLGAFDMTAWYKEQQNKNTIYTGTVLYKKVYSINII